jgi:hypothetical protein
MVRARPTRGAHSVPPRSYRRLLKPTSRASRSCQMPRVAERREHLPTPPPSDICRYSSRRIESTQPCTFKIWRDAPVAANAETDIFVPERNRIRSVLHAGGIDGRGRAASNRACPPTVKAVATGLGDCRSSFQCTISSVQHCSRSEDVFSLCGAQRTIIIYGFAPAVVLAELATEGVVTLRSPLDLHGLSRELTRPVAHHSLAREPLPSELAPRLFDNAMLEALANLAPA